MRGGAKPCHTYLIINLTVDKLLFCAIIAIALNLVG